MLPNLLFLADLVTFTEKILDGKLLFLCSVGLESNFQENILHVCNKIIQPSQATKRQILKATAEMFYHLELSTPGTLRAKFLLREL